MTTSPSKPVREKQIYRETYDRKATGTQDPTKLPSLAALKVPAMPGYEVVEMQLLAAGVVMRGDERLEYLDLRVYVKMP